MAVRACANSATPMLLCPSSRATGVVPLDPAAMSPISLMGIVAFSAGVSSAAALDERAIVSRNGLMLFFDVGFIYLPPRGWPGSSSREPPNTKHRRFQRREFAVHATFLLAPIGRRRVRSGRRPRVTGWHNARGDRPKLQPRDASDPIGSAPFSWYS